MRTLHYYPTHKNSSSSNDGDNATSTKTLYPQQQQQLQSSNKNNTSSGSHSSSSHASTASWRKRGERMRQAVIESDERVGGQAFLLSSSCPIHRYYHVADKVLDQFLHHPIDSPTELIEAYTVGHRLVKFLSKILPTHDDYFSDEADEREARDRSQEQLVAVLKYLDQIAILIDKQAHEDYIRSVLTDQEEPEHTPQQSVVPLPDESYYGDDDDVDKARRDNLPVRRQYEFQTDFNHKTNSSNNNARTIGGARLYTLRQQSGYSTSESSNSDVVSESIDVMLESDTSFQSAGVTSAVALREDPQSTPNHTLFRTSTKRSSHGVVVSKRDGAADNSSTDSIRGIAAPTRTKDSVSTQSNVQIPNPVTPDEERVAPVLLSPGGSVVRNRVRSWPPKPDPPAEKRYVSPMDKSVSSVEGSPTRVERMSSSLVSTDSTATGPNLSVTSGSSVDPSPRRRDRPSTPLPLEEHAIAANSPEVVRPLLQSGDSSPDEIRRQFKPLTVLPIQLSEKNDAESSFMDNMSRSDGRVTWADKHRLQSKQLDRTAFSSPSCSSRDSVEDVGPRDFSFKGNALTSRTFLQLGGDYHDLVSPTSHSIDPSNVVANTGISDTSVQASNRATSGDRRESNEDIVESGNESVREKRTVSPPESRATRPVSSGDTLTLEPSSPMPFLPSFSGGTDIHLISHGGNVATDSNGFPILLENVNSNNKGALSPSDFGGTGAGLNETNYQHLTADYSVFAMTPVLPLRFGPGGGDDAQVVTSEGLDVPPPSLEHSTNISFGSVDFNANGKKLSIESDDEAGVQEKRLQPDLKRTDAKPSIGSASRNREIPEAAVERDEGVSSMIPDAIDASDQSRITTLNAALSDVAGRLTATRETEEIRKQSSDFIAIDQPEQEQSSSKSVSQSHSSYAPSVADWNVDDIIQGRSSQRNVATISVDSMGFPVLTNQEVAPDLRGTSSIESGDKESSTRRGDCVVDLDDTIVDEANLSDISMTAPLRDFELTNASERTEPYAGSENRSNLNDGGISSRDSPMSYDVSTHSLLSQNAPAQYKAARILYPILADKLQYPLDGVHPVQHFPSTEETTSMGSRSSRSRELSSQDDLPASNSLAAYRKGEVNSLEVPFVLKEQVSPYLSESKLEQRLKLSFDEENQSPSFNPDSVELKAPLDLDLIGRHLEKSDRSLLRNRHDAARGTNFLCRKQKGSDEGLVHGHHQYPNEIDSLEETNLLDKRNTTRAAYHFKSCVRFLID